MERAQNPLSLGVIVKVLVATGAWFAGPVQQFQPSTFWEWLAVYVVTNLFAVVTAWLALKGKNAAATNKRPKARKVRSTKHEGVQAVNRQSADRHSRPDEGEHR